MIIALQEKNKKALWDRTCCFRLFFVWDDFSSVLSKLIPQKAVEYDYCVSWKISPKKHFGIEHAVLGLFFVWNDFSSFLAKIIPKKAVEYDYCVSWKINPKRHFGIEHAGLGLFFVWDDFSSVLANNPKKAAIIVCKQLFLGRRCTGRWRPSWNHTSTTLPGAGLL
jgi:hypothetical protein